jgi:hypothetical protein
MKILAQNGMNDIFLDDNGNFVFAEGVDAYATILADAVRTLIGELQLNVEAGIPWLETVFNSPNEIPLWKHNVSKTVLSYPFARSVTSIATEIIPGSKIMKYTITVVTDLGNVEVSSTTSIAS